MNLNNVKPMHVPFVNLAVQYAELENELVDIFRQVGRSGQYVFGPQVELFEKELSLVCQSNYALAVGNGTDALALALLGYGIGAGDEVITAPNSFIATAGAINEVGAEIRFADVDEDYNLDPQRVVEKISEKTKAIIVVHLTGNPAKMNEFRSIADEYGLVLIEDAAQAIGAKYQGRKVGSLGDVACFSLHPLKNFHLMGDAGFITMRDSEIFERVKKLRNHGLINRDEAGFWGRNSRCDTLQAAIGLKKLPYFEKWTARFQQIAAIYTSELTGIVQCPYFRKEDAPVFHNFVIQVEKRAEFMQILLDHGVETKIHYPVPLHLMQAAKNLGYKKGDFPVVEKQAERIVSLPIYPELSNEQVEHVVNTVKRAASLINIELKEA
ncbi:DegT/DnrJ/EryC1/StrS family aminotransferase [Catenovulum sediminis]|uniref:DegT/DnrJ/EryC1/StrS family aminotransferase n=1 Tax=Catenovulum sediminis TaxID=1740262 RepID=UPI001180FF4B|nr:DegT/DnrJ/EryC1/StrS family aminotransferase [Catenovulum sediminis]